MVYQNHGYVEKNRVYASMVYRHGDLSICVHAIPCPKSDGELDEHHGELDILASLKKDSQLQWEFVHGGSTVFYLEKPSCRSVPWDRHGLSFP